MLNAGVIRGTGGATKSGITTVSLPPGVEAVFDEEPRGHGFEGFADGSSHPYGCFY